MVAVEWIETHADASSQSENHKSEAEKPDFKGRQPCGIK
jgi:hypothetical protein